MNAYRAHHSVQCIPSIQWLPSSTVYTEQYSVYRAVQCIPSSSVFTEFVVFTELSNGFCVYRVNEGSSVYRVNKVNEGNSVYRVNKVNEEFRVYQVRKVKEVFNAYQVESNSTKHHNLYRVISGYQVPSHSEWLVRTVPLLLPNAWRCSVLQWMPSIRRSPSEFEEPVFSTIWPT